MTILKLYLQVFHQWFPDEAFSYCSVENHTVQMSQPFSENKCAIHCYNHFLLVSREGGLGRSDSVFVNLW